MVETAMIFAVEESPEGSDEARALGRSLDRQAETLEELRAMPRDR